MKKIKKRSGEENLRERKENEEEEREGRKWNERENTREVERGRKKRLRGIEKKNNNNNIEFSKQLFLNLKLHFKEDAEEILNLVEREHHKKKEQEAAERGRRGCWE